MSGSADCGSFHPSSYELFRRDEDQQKRIWEAITRGLTTRGYGPTVRESGKAFAIEKSAVSEKFVAMSARKVNELLKRDLSKLRLCALLLDWKLTTHRMAPVGFDSAAKRTEKCANVQCFRCIRQGFYLDKS